MSGTEACTCSLQARLHQIENARSREMEAHGELVQKLERELDARRVNEAEFRLTAAKVRTDKCRFEAELCAARTKTRQLLEQLDAQRIETSQREDELKALRGESDRRLQVTREKTDSLMEENRQLSFKLSQSTTCLENMKHENKLLLDTNAEQSLQANAQAVELEKLSSQLANKQHEFEALTVRSQLLLEDLASSREQQTFMQGQAEELHRDVNRALMTRDRALRWKQKHHDRLENRFISHGAFLAWKSISVQERLRSAAMMARSNDDTRIRLQVVEVEVMKRCSRSKEELSNIRQACASERMQMQSLRDEICETELPRLLTLLGNQQRSFDSQQLQLKNRRECLERERERQDMSRQDAEYRVQTLIKAYQVHFARQKEQLRFILRTCAARRQREVHRRTFSAWKEHYLRSVVGQATHTAMVFQSQLSHVPSLSPFGRREPQSWTMPAPIRPILIAVQPQQVEKQSSDDYLRSPMSEATTPIETMWRKWRRVDSGVARRGRKPRPSPNSRT